MKRPLCIGHRGAKGHMPENTLPSFAKAIELGCDWVELDVYLIEDQLVVFHDKKLDRTTNGSGPIEDIGFDGLRELDAGNGARIPTLNEVLDLIAGRCGVNVELKGRDTAQAVNRLLVDRCDAGWKRDQFLISSFDHRELAEADPQFKRGALFGKLLDDQWERAATLDAWSVNFDFKDLSSDLVDEAHSRGYKVLVYTVNETEDLRFAIECGVDGIFSDYPDRLIELLD